MLAAALYGWPGLVSFGLTIAIFFVFPTGTLPSPRWRWAVWLLAGLTVASAVATALAPVPIEVDAGLGHPVTITNPLAVGGPLGSLLQLGSLLGGGVLLVPLALGVAATILRFRRSQGVERAQLKWLALGGAVLVVIVAGAFAGLVVYPPERSQPLWAQALLILAILSVSLIPIAAGIAILRYRLYDVDLLINRTLVYGSVTALLALASPWPTSPCNGCWCRSPANPRTL